MMRGQGLFERAMRGSAVTALTFLLAQVLRLASNLILTRLLAPEAFGLMALVSMVLIGLTLFSDMGIGPSISQHPRGDDPDFLNTAWTIQILRGFLLWLAATALALPAAWFYGAPQLAVVLPVAAVSLAIGGFVPTRVESANRHLMLERVMLLDLAVQAAVLAVMVLLAWWTGSVWALVIGGVLTPVIRIPVMLRYLPGVPNRLQLERAAALDLIHFGKWIFLSTVGGFFLLQGDRAILGAHLTLSELGIYNIGAFLATFPMLLGQAVTGRVLIPLYREARDPVGGAAVRARLMRLRYGLTAVLLALLALLAFGGVLIVRLLYSPSYHEAGAIAVALSCVLMPQVIGLSYDQAALAAGDSRRFFFVTFARATMQTGFFLIGVQHWGLAGALIGQAVAILLAHPLLAWLAWLNGVWDARHDAVYFALVAVLVVLALTLNRAEVATLAMGHP